MNWLLRQQLRALAALAACQSSAWTECSPVTCCGLDFRNPIGAAAGLDRDARLLSAFQAFGFGFSEIGTINDPVTGRNAAARLRNWRRYPPAGLPMRIGVSIGSLRPDLDSVAATQCAELAGLFAHAADFLVLNLSRPGSPGRSTRPDATGMHLLMKSVRTELNVRAATGARTVPLFVKFIADAVTPESVPAVALHAAAAGCDGLVAAFENRDSGTAAMERLGTIRTTLPALPIIAVGGIRCTADATDYMHEGALLLEIHRALLSQGPRIVQRLVNGLAYESMPDQ